MKSQTLLEGLGALRAVPALSWGPCAAPAALVGLFELSSLWGGLGSAELIGEANLGNSKETEKHFSGFSQSL